MWNIRPESNKWIKWTRRIGTSFKVFTYVSLICFPAAFSSSVKFPMIFNSLLQAAESSNQPFFKSSRLENPLYFSIKPVRKKNLLNSFVEAPLLPDSSHISSLKTLLYVLVSVLLVGAKTRKVTAFTLAIKKGVISCTKLWRFLLPSCWQSGRNSTRTWKGGFCWICLFTWGIFMIGFVWWKSKLVYGCLLLFAFNVSFVKG